MKRLLWNIMATVSLLIMTIGCGTNEEGGENGEELTFTLTSTDLNCNTSKDIRVNAPFTGKTYTLTVSASAKTVWSVAVESGDLVTVSTAQITLTQPTIGISSNPADHRVRQHEGICQKDQKAQDGDVPDGPGGRAGNTF